MEIVFETRFAFFGKSGWRADTSKKPKLLFEDSRMKTRFHYFEHITLPSLKAQTDPDFRQIVLSSLRMPEKWQKQLNEMCYDILGEKRCKVHFNGWGLAGRVFRRQMAEIYEDDETQLAAQVVLDDDDAVSKDFVEICRRESVNAAHHFKSAQDYSYLSFPKGYSMSIAKNKLSFVDRNAPFTNLGLTLIAPANTEQNPFLTSHKMIGERHPYRMISDTPPSYIRAVHAENDSLALHGDTEEIPLKIVKEQFPSIAKFHKLLSKG